MNVSQLRAEITRLREAIRVAAAKTKAEDAWKDKLTAGLIRIERAIKKLRGEK